MTEKHQNINELLSRLRELGIRLQADKDRLKVDAPVGILSSSLREELLRHKSEIIRYFDSDEFLRPDDSSPIPLRSRDGELEVSFSQERLWFLSRLEPGNTAYNICGGIRLEGRLRQEVVEQSLSEIIRRHEALRTIFEEINSKPVQVISPKAAFKLPVLGLEALPEADRAARLQQIIADEARRPFDLSAGPLFRAVLVRLGQEEHVLVLVMHHIITDGWSLGVFTRELESLYSAFCEGRPSPLADLPVQYADYAAWQRERLQGKILDTQVKYWRQKLGEELPVLQLPTDRPRSAVQTHHGARHGFDLPGGLSERMEDLSRQQGVTLYMLLLAAFKVLLYRYTGQSDFGVGSPIANRTLPELEGLIGFFVNTLVLRADMSGDPGFIELLSRVRETTLGAFDHQELPFEKLVEIVNPAREMSYSPLFQVMFVLQNMPGAGVQLPGLRLSSVAIDSGASMFDLTLFMWKRDQRLSGSVEYNTDLFDAERIERMVGHFQTLLEGIVADPARRLSELPVLPEAERQQLLVEWNDTVVEYPWDKCIPELFEKQVERTPDAIAVTDNNEKTTYQELNERANQLAHYLKELGVGPQVVVGLCIKRSVELVIGIMGILKAGGIYLPLDPSYPEQRLSYMLEDSRAQILLTAKNAEPVVPKSKTQILYLDADDWSFAQHRSEDPVSCAQAETPAYLIYTSGSTGRPKGVIGLQRGLLNRFNWMWKTYPFGAGEVCSQKTSISFVDSIWEILGPLLQGIKTVIISDEEVKEPRLFIKKLADEQVTRIIAVPSYLRVLLDADSDLQKRLPRLKFWISSGEILSKELYQAFRDKLPQSMLLNLYGSSEVSADVTCCDTNSMSAIPQSVPIGRPIANTQVYILDHHLQPVPIGVPGELYIDGENLAAGYLNLGEITANAFFPNPYSDKPDSRLFKTGDKGRWFADGNIEFIGRVDHQVKIRGFRIEMGEVEAVLNKHPDVKESIVLAREYRPNDKRLVAYIVLRRKPAPATSELNLFLKQNLPDYMLPSAFVFLDALPLTTSGKVDRKALPAPDRNLSHPAEALDAPHDELELQLIKIWEKVLGVKNIGMEDNFFDLGGHSLLAVRLFARIQKIFGKDLPLTTLFQAPTIGQLAHIIRQEGWSSPWSSLVPVQHGGSKPPFFCVHGCTGKVMHFYDLARLLGPEQPFYGLSALGLEKGQVPHTRIEDMAAHYINEIRKIQFNGPYFIGGSGWGCAIVLEMAHQLESQGQNLALIALLTPSPLKPKLSSNNLDTYDRSLRKFFRLLIILLKNLWFILLNNRPLIPAIYDAFSNRVLWHFRIFHRFIPIEVHRRRRYIKAFSEARLSYTPEAFHGPITCILQKEFASNPQKGLGDWQNFAAGGLDIQFVPGNIFTMWEAPHVQILAEKLTACLNEAQKKVENS